MHILLLTATLEQGSDEEVLIVLAAWRPLSLLASNTIVN